MVFKNSLKKLGLVGILAIGIFGNGASAQPPVTYGPVPNTPVIRGPLVVVRPPERIIIQDPIVVYPPVTASKVESICFNLPGLEPGDYKTIIERREGFCDALNSSWNFTMTPVASGRIIPNSRQNNTSWEINLPSGHYELFISGAGKRHRLGCANLNPGDKIQFYKTSERFTENHVIKPHPYKPGWIIKEEPIETFRSSIRVINPDGSSYFSVTETDRSGNVVRKYNEPSEKRFERNPDAPLPYSTTPWIRHPDGTLELGRP